MKHIKKCQERYPVLFDQIPTKKPNEYGISKITKQVLKLLVQFSPCHKIHFTKKKHNYQLLNFLVQNLKIRGILRQNRSSYPHKKELFCDIID